MQRRHLAPRYDYIRLSVTPPTPDAISLRKAIQDALGQSFGMISSHTYADVLWVSEEGGEFVIRMGPSDTEKLLAAITAASTTPRLSFVKRSTFLPSLLSVKAPA